jgi:hypothetical protein
MLAGALQEITRNESVAVGVASIVVAPMRSTLPKRKVITIRNNSPNAADIITLSFGQNAAVANAGIILKQYESMTDANDGGYECYQDQISAICATANGVLAIFER